MGEALIVRKGGGSDLTYRVYSNPDRQNLGNKICDLKKDCYVYVRYQYDQNELQAYNLILEYKNGTVTIINQAPSTNVTFAPKVENGELSITASSSRYYNITTIVIE